MKKKRKPRGVKLSKRMSEDLCPHCYSRRCDSVGRIMSNTIANRKITKRIRLGLCPACGAKPCKCKSKL